MNINLVKQQQIFALMVKQSKHLQTLTATSSVLVGSRQLLLLAIILFPSVDVFWLSK